MATKLIFPKLKNTELLRNTGCQREKNKASGTICHQVLSMEAQESRKMSSSFKYGSTRKQK
jgi:hypothetical protein